MSEPAPRRPDSPPGRGHDEAPIERAGPNDLMELASDTRDAPMLVAGVLELTPATPLTLDEVRSTITERVVTVPRLRQRLVDTPFGAGAPIWIDAGDFRIDDHVRERPASPPGDEQALLDVATELITTPLPMHRPLWSATLVTGLAEERSAIVVVFHHVLADGIGGLAVLANLVDGPTTPVDPTPGFPRRAPDARSLHRDAWRRRYRAVTRLPAGLRHLRGGLTELRSGGATKAATTSLNRPTGPRRAAHVARAELDLVHLVARGHGATVNDVVLAVVARSLHTVAARRGETLDHLVVSVPVSARQEAGAADLGNQVGVLPIDVPTIGSVPEQLRVIAPVTRHHKHTSRGSSAAVVAPLLRLLARLGALRWFIDRQRLVNTFVTNLRGPDERLGFLGAPIERVVAVSTLTGNVTVAFAVLSYAGELSITVIVDPDACPDHQAIAEVLQAELDGLEGLAGRDG